MLIGYAQVSTDDQNLDLQRDALKGAGCEQMFEDMVSGAKADRTGLAVMMTVLRADDAIVIWRLDRLGRSLKNLIELVERFESAKVGLRSLQENIDTTTSGGRLVFHLFGALAEFERNLIRERTQAGIAAARAWQDGWTAEATRPRQTGIGFAASPRRQVHDQGNLPDDGHFQIDAVQLPRQG